MGLEAGVGLETFKAESIPIARGSQDGIPHPTHASFFFFFFSPPSLPCFVLFTK